MNPETENAGEVAQARQQLEHAFDYYEKDELTKALAVCDGALELDPYLADAHNLRGVLLEALNRQLEAIKAYRQAIQLDPDFVEAQENLSDLKAELAAQGRLVTIATFSYPTEAYIPKTKLESAGIWAFIADEYLVMMNWLYSNAIGGVKLQVREADVERALSVLSLTKDDVEPEEDEIDTLEDAVACPSCGSLKVGYERYAMKLVFGSWLLSLLVLAFIFGVDGGVAFPFLKRRWKCRVCGYEWQVSK
jgi:tetratricopeptide (TPR) repeat protein